METKKTAGGLNLRQRQSLYDIITTRIYTHVATYLRGTQQKK